MQSKSRKIITSPDDLNLLKEKLQEEIKGKRIISICSGTGCKACSSDDIYNVLSNEFSEMQKTCPDKIKDIILKRTGCHGFCENGPIIVIHPEGTCYIKSKVEDAEEIFKKTVEGEIVTRLLYKDTDEIGVEKESDIPFYKYQKRIILENNSRIDPLSIEDYIRLDGYRSLIKVLTGMTPDDVIKEIKESNLRGRGGGGFPAGKKWETTKNAKGELKYIIVNADEGDPGAFMDRSVLEGNPHSVIEGLVIAAYSIGSSEGYVYVRQEYPLAVNNLTYAIQQAEEYGFLGQNILNSGFNFDVKINCGAGAFVCGEETALIQSIEGKRGMPRPKPPFPANKGLYGMPTLINNVETYANVPYIINNGAEWFKNIGTDASKGTKIFALTGAVNNVGLVEVPMGITLRDIVFKIGGGVKGGRKFKAVQMGGPSGGCIPEKYLDIPLDYERVKETGAIMGSGGMIVLDENTCMVNLSRYFMDFIQDESCGQCTPCRVGTRRMLEILEKITVGKGDRADIEKLEKLGAAIKETSLCGLGKTAPNPVLSTINYFKDEYLAHVDKKRCPAVECKEIISSACQNTCPIETEVQSYVAFIAQGRFKEAFDVILKDNPLPSICSRVCHHPCETKCEAGKWGNPVEIRSLKRFASDHAIKSGIYPGAAQKKAEQEGGTKVKKAAIIGSGPAGLMAAYKLGIAGFDVTVFEELEVPGGGLAVYIPDFRLPKEILSIDLEHIKNSGVKIKTNTKIGRDIAFEKILKDFKSVFIATGAHNSRKLGIENDNARGVVSATDFLKEVNLKKPVKVGRFVGVIGGGNSAVDAARVAARLPGCESVTVIYRRTIKEMPAFEEEVEALIEEGIEVKFLTAPVRVLTEKGILTGLVCQKMELGEVDSTGRRKPVPVKNSEFIIPLDMVIAAIGEYCDLSFLGQASKLEITKYGTIKVDPETFQTSVKGVFAGGDAVTGPATAIEAMGAGKIAAEMMEKYLTGKPVKREYSMTRPSMYVPPLVMSDEEINNINQQLPGYFIDRERMDEFKGSLTDMPDAQAIREAKRCVRCDLETEQGKMLLKKSQM